MRQRGNAAREYLDYRIAPVLVPVHQSILVFEAAAASGRDTTIKVFARTNHGIRDPKRKDFAPSYFETMTE